MTKLANKIRIIAGKWRGRKLTFASSKDLRPTGDRIRETLFNWLAPSIRGSHCLDLFAGSGCLGFEALSRGAGRVVMVDNNPQVTDNLQISAAMLHTEAADVKLINAAEYLAHTDETFDIVFLDPPFKQKDIADYCQLLVTHNCLNHNAKVYIETDKSLAFDVPADWQELRAKQTGNVSYYLCEIL